MSARSVHATGFFLRKLAATRRHAAMPGRLTYPRAGVPVWFASTLTSGAPGSPRFDTTRTAPVISSCSEHCRGRTRHACKQSPPSRSRRRGCGWRQLRGLPPWQTEPGSNQAGLSASPANGHGRRTSCSRQVPVTASSQGRLGMALSTGRECGAVARSQGSSRASSGGCATTLFPATEEGQWPQIS